MVQLVSATVTAAICVINQTVQTKSTKHILLSYNYVCVCVCVCVSYIPYKYTAYNEAVEQLKTINHLSLIIIFINSNWVDTRWQWLFYMYTKYEIGYY
jgi:hypothetical protein